MNGNAHAIDTLVNAQTAGSVWASMGWTQRVLLRLVGGRFVAFSVAAGRSAHLASGTHDTPLRRIGGLRASRLLGGH